ncbi:cytochrome b [Sphingomonas solaris]|uniref:Cytochrome b n=1 Tax=Alterirhizorhabdus solaris TaxID=2529389 RepID=A0A558R7C1_9SPHN|nr:cytochrome b [Sphingomonas solaris]TVV75289.1 cytochrome b [Sphingomonas solaris]
MARAERGDRYTRVAIWLHWVIAAFVLYNLTGGIYGSFLPETAPNPLFSGHKALGITILFLSLARLAWRLTHRPPPLPAMPRWQAGSAHALHWLFYVLIILMPLSGWIFSSAGMKRWPLNWFGLFDIPYLPIAQSVTGGAPAFTFHVYAGWIMAGLVMLHIAAALKHHLVDRDRTLARMLPGAEPRQG